MILGLSQDGRSVKWRHHFHEEKWYLLDKLDAAGFEIKPEAREDIMFAFYEEAFDYWINLDTGEITFDSVA